MVFSLRGRPFREQSRLLSLCKTKLRLPASYSLDDKLKTLQTVLVCVRVCAHTHTHSPVYTVCLGKGHLVSCHTWSPACTVCSVQDSDPRCDPTVVWSLRCLSMAEKHMLRTTGSRQDLSVQGKPQSGHGHVGYSYSLS